MVKLSVETTPFILKIELKTHYSKYSCIIGIYNYFTFQLQTSKHFQFAEKILMKIMFKFNAEA